MTSTEIVPFDEDHIEDAVSRVSARYRAEKTLVQHLPGRFEDAERIVPLLQSLVRGSPGVVVVRDGVWT